MSENNINLIQKDLSTVYQFQLQLSQCQCRSSNDVINNFLILSNKLIHTGDFPRGVGHRVENGCVLTKVAVVLLNGLIW